MDIFNFQTTIGLRRPKGQRAALAVAAVVAFLLSAHFGQLMLTRDATGDNAGPWLLSLALAIAFLVLAAFCVAAWNGEVTTTASISLLFSGDGIRLGYTGIDRRDGRGIHNENFQLSPKNIRKLALDANGRVTLEHEEEGHKKPLHEVWHLGDLDAGMKLALLDRLARYDEEHLHKGGLPAALREAVAGAGAADAAALSTAAVSGAASAAAGPAPQPTVDAASAAPDSPAAARGRLGLRELQVSESKRKKLQASYLLEYLALAVLIALVPPLLLMTPVWISYGYSPLDALQAPSTLSYLASTALPTLFLCLIFAGIFYSQKSGRCKSQRIFVGPGRLMCSGTGSSRGEPYNDYAEGLHLISRIEGYDVKPRVIVVRGSFAREDAGRYGRRRTNNIGSFKILRIVKDEERLTSCLDGLTRTPQR